MCKMVGTEEIELRPRNVLFLARPLTYGIESILSKIELVQDFVVDIVA